MTGAGASHPRLPRPPASPNLYRRCSETSRKSMTATPSGTVAPAWSSLIQIGTAPASRAKASFTADERSESGNPESISTAISPRRSGSQMSVSSRPYLTAPGGMTGSLTSL